MTREVGLWQGDREFTGQGAGGRRRPAGRHRAILCAIVAASCVAGIGFAQQPPLRAPDVRYEPTPMDVVGAMLRLAKRERWRRRVRPRVRRRAHRHHGRAPVRRARRLRRHRSATHCRKPGERASGRCHRAHPVSERRISSRLASTTQPWSCSSSRASSTSRCGRSSYANSNPVRASSRIGTTWATGSRKRPSASRAAVESARFISGPSRNAEEPKGSGGAGA